MARSKTNSAASPLTLRLVSATADKLRDLILAKEPDALIGSLPELAKLLCVGVVTVQQAARILEHEGILKVRRGTGGGYFGCRPDVSSLERALATYLRVRRTDNYEALEMMTLLDCELMPAAARCADQRLAGELRTIKGRIDGCRTTQDRIVLEDDFHEVLFQMINRPLIELLAQVSMRFYRSQPIPPIFEGEEGFGAWRRWRHQIIDAILARDPERAQFEAERHRRDLLNRLRRTTASTGSNLTAPAA